MLASVNLGKKACPTAFVQGRPLSIYLMKNFRRGRKTGNSS